MDKEPKLRFRMMTFREKRTFLKFSFIVLLRLTPGSELRTLLVELREPFVVLRIKAELTISKAST